MNKVKVSSHLLPFLFLLLFLQISHVFFHAFHHPFFEEIHAECTNYEKVVEPPFFNALGERKIRNCDQEYASSHEPEIRHDFVVQLHSKSFDKDNGFCGV